MAKDFDRMENSNRSANPSIHEVSDPARRVFLLDGIGALAVGALSPWLTGRAVAAGRGPLLGFNPVPVSEKDRVLVPEGYEAVPIAAWGEPVGVPDNMPAFRWDASNSAAARRATFSGPPGWTGRSGSRSTRTPAPSSAA